MYISDSSGQLQSINIIGKSFVCAQQTVDYSWAFTTKGQLCVFTISIRTQAASSVIEAG